MTGWPALRTRAVPSGAIGAGPLLAACLAALVAVPLASGLAAALLDAWLHPPHVPGRTGIGTVRRGLWVALVTLAYSPFLSWAALPAAVPLAMLALRPGWAGWLVAASAGAAVAPFAAALGLVLVTGRAGSLALVPIPVGAALGGAFWLGAKLARPQLILGPGDAA